MGLFCFGYSGPIYAAAVRSCQDVLSGAETPEERFALVDFGLIKTGLGRLPMPSPSTDYLVRQMEKNRVALLPIRVEHLAEL